MAEQVDNGLAAFAKEGRIDASEFAPVLPGAVVWDVKIHKDFVAEHAVIPQTAELSKIVFHINKLAPRVANRLSLYLRDEITLKMKPPALVEAGHSPLFRDQWDLVLFHLPVFRAPMIRDAILQILDRFSM